MPGIGVISNRNSRLNRLNPELKDQLAFVIGSDGDVNSTSSINDVYKAIETFRRIGIDIIAISGGDGTAHRTMEIIIEVYGNSKIPPILLLPTGTMNMVPRSFGIDGSGLANLLLADARYRHNIPMRCIQRNMLCVNNHVSFMFGIGVAARFMKSFYDAGDRSPKGAARILTRLVCDALVDGELTRYHLEPMDMTLELDGKLIAEHAPLHTCFASFIERLPLHFILFPKAGRREGVFEVVYSKARPIDVAKRFPAILSGTTVPDNVLTHAMARTLTIQLAKPEFYTLDGELYDPVDRFELKAGPVIDFLVPALRFAGEDENLRYSKVGPWSMRYLL